MEQIDGVYTSVLAHAMADSAAELLRQSKRGEMGKKQAGERIAVIVKAAVTQTGTTPQQMGKWIKEQEQLKVVRANF